MSNEVGVSRALNIVERYGVSVEHIPTGVDSFGIVVNASDVKDTVFIPSLAIFVARLSLMTLRW